MGTEVGSSASPPEVSAVEVELTMGTEVSADGPVGVASSCPQNPLTTDVADAMSVRKVLHPVAATEEAAEIAAGN